MKKLVIFTLLLKISSFAQAYEFEATCSINTKTEGLSFFENSVKLAASRAIKVNPKIRKKMAFNNQRLSALFSNGDCYWVTSGGKIMRTYCFDNGSDYFVDGLARYISPKGKFGFMDEKLRIVIPAQFDFVFPFENGKAQYCNGCKSVQAGEHSSMTGVDWRYIDKSGHPIESKTASPSLKQ